LLIRQAGTATLGLAGIATAMAALLRLAVAANGVAAGAVERATSALDALERLPQTVETADRPLQRSKSSTPVDLGRPQLGPPRVRFDGVWFRYPGADVDVLRGLDLSIGAGESIGLVGMNGAGKSTLTHLLTGALRPTAGRIFVDEVDLATLDEPDLRAWQRRLAVVAQDFLRLPLTAQENVALAEPLDLERLNAVAGIAGVDSAVAGLPLGWQTMLDRSVTNGGELSGGQWQRLALARALYSVRTGAGMLLLDEPAAALDVRSEAELVDRYLRLTTEVTSLVISHRFSVVRDADRICVLQDGAVVEQGTHEELMARRSQYAAMFQLQAARYVNTEGAS
jgi:ATP-binding cassette subfamily B protein